MKKNWIYIIIIIAITTCFSIYAENRKRGLMEEVRTGCAKVLSVNKHSKGTTTFQTTMKLKFIFSDTSYHVIKSVSGLVDIDSATK
jgi:hypothetical protein